MEERILVCLSSSPSNGKIIRTAAQMAEAFNGTLTALFVETPLAGKMGKEDQERLKGNIKLAKQSGAEIETVYGDDISFQIAEFARLSGITRIVIGRSAAKKKGIFAGTSLVEKLIDHAPEMEIYIIPDSQMGPEVIRKWNRLAQKNDFSLKAAVQSAGILFAATAAGWMFEKLKLTDANIITVYILGVLLISIVTEGWFYSFSATIASVLVFNFLFTAPRFTLRAYDRSYPFTFAVMFLAALITGSLASRLKQHAGQAARDAYRLKVLLDTNQLLQQAKGKSEILEGTAQQIVKLLKRETVIYDVKNGKLGQPLHTIPQGGEILVEDETCEEQAAVWALENNRHAGTGTDHFKQAKRQYLAIRVNSTVYGVVGIMIRKQPLDAFENSVLLSILGECALALENDKNVREKEEAAILAKNEQLRANLLRTISHDLRTPLTSISGNANNLLYNESCLDAQMRRQIYGDIYDDSMWLIDLVENLLSVTRIEEGRMQIRQSAELVDEVIREALKHTGQSRTGRTIKVEEEDELILAKMDARLIVQVLINLIGNAVKYTPQGTDITVRVKKEKTENSQVIISVCDLGDGIPDDRKERVFDMFYTGSDQVADSRRSLGLGLGLCRSIINAHGGKIWISDNIPHGAVVTFTLPAEEVALNE
jgi:two-component system sensor histidine kinase KdpD